MESANSHHHHHHHHHQLQDQLLGSSAPSLPNYGVAFTTSHANWPPSSFLNSNCSETKQQEALSPSASSHSYTSMAPDVGFNGWQHHSSEQDSRIKEELADHYYHRYSEILSSGDEVNLIRNQQQDSDLQGNDVATKFLLKSLASYGKMAPDLYATRQILPQYYPVAGAAPGSLDMNLEALDLLASSRFNGNFVAASQSQIGMLRDEFSSYGLDQMHQSHEIPFYASNKVSSASSNTVTEAKRNSNKLEPKSQIQKAPKKSRLEARSSCPPFKVRKEKLGDRIAALQQLVAPFGKTDTASVLMEAIGYIKFLQTQVETLSVPYMKASRNKTNRITKGGSIENENEEAKGDLKSRGLCLVPLSCLSYITDGGGAAVWPPSHFGGAT